MPESYPQFPSGAQTQAYLDSFVDKFDLRKHIHLCTEVVKAHQDPTMPNWTIETRPSNADGTSNTSAAVVTWSFDVLYICNGTLSETFVPKYPGEAAFVKAGGRVCHTSEFLSEEEAKGKDVIIVGYGKSACDTAVALSRVATSTVCRVLLHYTIDITKCT